MNLGVSLETLKPDENRANEPIIILDFESHRKRKQSFLPGSLQAGEEDRKSKFLHGVNFLGSRRPSTELFEKPYVSTFLTGSKYSGQFNDLGLAGRGIYKYPHGVIYDGNFNRNGEFHGSGVLIYPNGHRIQGFWREGKLTSRGLSRQDWLLRENYCRMPDRRFQREVEAELQPANQENLTNDDIVRVIPKGCYDAGEGFYDPKMHVIRNYANMELVKSVKESDEWLEFEKECYRDILQLSLSEADLLWLMQSWVHEEHRLIRSVPIKNKSDWIKSFCRKAEDDPVGYRPDLYETWTTGSRKYQTGNAKEMEDVVSMNVAGSETSITTTCIDSFFMLVPTLDYGSWTEKGLYPGKTSTKTRLMFVTDIKANLLNRLILERLKRKSSTKQRKSTRINTRKHVRTKLN